MIRNILKAGAIIIFLFSFSQGAFAITTTQLFPDIYGSTAWDPACPVPGQFAYATRLYVDNILQYEVASSPACHAWGMTSYGLEYGYFSDDFFYPGRAPNGLHRIEFAYSGSDAAPDWSQNVHYFGARRTGVETWIAEATERIVLEDGCSLFSLGCLFKAALKWAFYPSQDSLENFAELKDDLENKPPFGYFGAVLVPLQNIASTSPAVTLTYTSAISSILTPIRNGIIILLWILFGYWIFNRIRLFDFHL